MTVIELDGLTMEFGDVTAVDGIDLDVEEGEVFGFLGPNGAGKSTTINIMLDFLRPTAGEARIFGMDSRLGSLPIRRRTGFLPEGYEVYDRLTGRKHLELMIESKEASDDPDALLDRVGLSGAGDRKAGAYSTGMKQRLAFAVALVGDPELLVLDEPHAGLDPNGVEKLLDIIDEENGRGTTVFFSSHILQHVESICDRVAILDRGEIVTIDSIQGLRNSLGLSREMSLVLDEVTDAAVQAVRSMEGVDDVRVDGSSLTVTCPDELQAEVVRALGYENVSIRRIETADVSLDELFAIYTQAEGTDVASRGDEVDPEPSRRVEESR